MTGAPNRCRGPPSATAGSGPDRPATTAAARADGSDDETRGQPRRFRSAGHLAAAGVHHQDRRAVRPTGLRAERRPRSRGRPRSWWRDRCRLVGRQTRGAGPPHCRGGAGRRRRAARGREPRAVRRVGRPCAGTARGRSGHPGSCFRRRAGTGHRRGVRAPPLGGGGVLLRHGRAGPGCPAGDPPRRRGCVGGTAQARSVAGADRPDPVAGCGALLVTEPAGGPLVLPGGMGAALARGRPAHGQRRRVAARAR